MLAKDNSYIADAASTVYQLSQDELIRLQCEAQEDYYRTQLGLKHEIDKWKTSTAELTDKVQELSSKNEVLTSEKEVLVSEKEALLAWAIAHGYQQD